MMTDSGAAEVGFLLATTIITAAINLHWRHYIRYFIGRYPEYGSRKVRILRLAFILAFLSSVAQFVLSVFSEVGISEHVVSILEVAILTLVAFVLIDGLFRILWK